MKKIRQRYSAAAFVAVFAFAGRALSVGKGTALDGIIAAAVAIFIIPLATVAASSFFEGGRGRVQNTIFAVTVIVVSTYIAAVSVKDLISFASEVMLFRMQALPIGVVFLFLCAFLASQGERAVCKLALISFIITAVTVILLFVLSARSFDTWGKEAILSGSPTVMGVLREFGEIFAPAVLAVIYLSIDGDSGLRPHRSVLAVVMVSVLLFLCRLNVRLLFSESFAAVREYPYSEAVSTITAGKLFARMEGWAYLMYFSSGVIRVTACISLSCRLLPNVWKASKMGKFVPYVVSGIVLLCLL